MHNKATTNLPLIQILLCKPFHSGFRAATKKLIGSGHPALQTFSFRTAARKPVDSGHSALQTFSLSVPTRKPVDSGHPDPALQTFSLRTAARKPVDSGHPDPALQTFSLRGQRLEYLQTQGIMLCNPLSVVYIYL